MWKRLPRATNGLAHHARNATQAGRVNPRYWRRIDDFWKSILGVIYLFRTLKMIFSGAVGGQRRVTMGEILIANDLSQIVKRAGGMLPLEVYQALFDVAGSGDGADFIEIGTAHGASAIALCLGARAAGKTPRIITVDPLSGPFSSRARYGGPDENRAIIQRNFEASGTANDIELFVGDSEALAGSGRLHAAADIIFLDSDGRIDRDLIHLMPFLKEDALIIIDDVKPYTKLSIRSNGAPFVDLKHKISSLLLECLLSMGWILVEQVVGATAFCRRARASRWSVAELKGAALTCYRELVFIETSLAELTAWQARAQAASRPAE